MQKLLLHLTILISIIIGIIACNNHSHEVIFVTLEIEHTADIEKVFLLVGNHQDSILIDNNSHIIKLKAPLKGEGTFQICVHKSNDTFCSFENYVEGGYRPKMIFQSDTFAMKRFF